MGTYYFGNIAPTGTEMEVKLNELVTMPKAQID